MPAFGSCTGSLDKFLKEYPRAPSILTMPTLGPDVFELDLLWAVGSLRVSPKTLLEGLLTCSNDGPCPACCGAPVRSLVV